MVTMSTKNANSFCGHDATQFVEVANHQHNTFPCGACKTPIVGKRFICKTCGYTLHPFCKTCPASLSLKTLHPQHELALLSTPSGAPPSRQCDVCQEPIEGTFYSCHASQQCDFDVHPVCSQMPSRVPHVLDTTHGLQLQHQPKGTRFCDVCRDECGGWAYRSAVFDVHFGCLLTPTDTAKATAPGVPVKLQGATTTTRSIIQANQGPGPAQGQGQPAPNPYGMGWGPQPQQQPFYFGSCHFQYPPYMGYGYAMPQQLGPYGWPHPGGAYPYGNGTVNAATQSSRGSSVSSRLMKGVGMNVLAGIVVAMMGF